MNLKKLLAVLCACVLVFALAVPTFASATPGGIIPNGTQIDFEGSLPSSPDTTVSVSVLTGLTKLYVNPYGLPYKIADGEVDTGETIKEGTTTDGWFSNTAAIKNESDTDLKVKVTMTTTENGNVKVVATDPTGTSPANNTLYGHFQITDATYDNATKVITPGTWASAKQVVIPAGSGQSGVAGTPTSPTDTEYVLSKVTSDRVGGQDIEVPGMAAFRLRGIAVIGADASNGNAGWDENDLADVTVAFSFAPAS